MEKSSWATAAVNEDDDSGGEQDELNLPVSPPSVGGGAPPIRVAAPPPIAPPTPPQSRSNVLTTFKVPFALSEAEIIFTGERIEPEDFDALSEYVGIFKKQYERKIAAQKVKDAETQLHRELRDEKTPP
jgi:hypothetical protein